MRSNARSRSSPQPRWHGPVIAVSIGAMAVLVIVSRLGLLLSQPRGTSNIELELSAVASIASGERPTTIIVSTPNSNGCRRYQLNVDTGVRNDQGPGNCNADGSKQPGRLEAISKAFRNR